MLDVVGGDGASDDVAAARQRGGKQEEVSLCRCVRRSANITLKRSHSVAVFRHQQGNRVVVSSGGGSIQQ